MAEMENPDGYENWRISFVIRQLSTIPALFAKDLRR